MHEVRLKIRHANLLLCGLFWVFDVVTPEWVGAEACFWWEISRDHFLFLRLQKIFEAERKVIQSTPDNSNLQGKSKNAQVIRSSKKIAGSKEKNSFYCTVNILITAICWNVKWKLKDTLDYKSERNVTKCCLNRACVLLFWEVKLFHVTFVTNKISLH